MLLPERLVVEPVVPVEREPPVVLFAPVDEPVEPMYGVGTARGVGVGATQGVGVGEG